MRKLPRLTRRDQVEVCGVYGQPVFDFYQQARIILERAAPDRHLSGFFAEPHVNPTRGEIAWYSNAIGGVRSMSQLNPTERAAVWSEVNVIREQVRVAGERFAAEGGAAAGTRAEIFKAMLFATDLEQCLFLVGDQPVLCEWGCKALGKAPSAGDLGSFGSAIRPVTEQTDAVHGGRPTSSLGPSVDAPRPTIGLAPSKQDSVAIDTEAVATPVPKPPEDVPSKSQAEGKKTDMLAAARIPVAPPTHESGRLTYEVSELPSSRSSHENLLRPSNVRPGLWPFLKCAIVSFFLLLLILILFRAFGDVGVVASVGNASQLEEAQLRKEIAVLRKQASDILATCQVR